MTERVKTCPSKHGTGGRMTESELKGGEME